MKLLSIYDSILGENTQITEGIKEFYQRFIEKNQNPNFIKENFRNPDFELRMVSEGGVIKINYGQSNKCETNTFDFIKEKVKSGINRYFPVSGWVFLPSTTYFEHFWVYDDYEDLFVDITPTKDIIAYGGVINKTINDDIAKSNNFFDVEFLKGKHHTSLYSKHMDKDATIRLNPYNKKFNNKDEVVFNLINNRDNFLEVKNYISNNPHINTINDLKDELNKLTGLMDKIRNNKEWLLINKIYRDIDRLITYYTV
jgi:hypothetical protein